MALVIQISGILEKKKDLDTDVHRLCHNLREFQFFGNTSQKNLTFVSDDFPARQENVIHKLEDVLMMKRMKDIKNSLVTMLVVIELLL